MSEVRRHPSDGSPLGCILALVLIFLPGNVYAGGGPPSMWGFALFHGALLALPFAYLGLKGTNARRPWLVVIGLMLCFWAGPTAVTATRPESEDIVLETLMGLVILASPFFAIAGARLAMRATTRPRV